MVEISSRVSDQPAYILHKRDYRESSIILDLFTRDFGRLSLMVNGAKKRRDVSSFQICNQLSISFSGRGELKNLTHIDSQQIPVAKECYMSIYYINELLLYLLPNYDEHIDLFWSYQKFILSINIDNMAESLRNIELDLLAELGYMPDIITDNLTGQMVDNTTMYAVNAEGVSKVDKNTRDCYEGYILIAIYNRDFNSSVVLRAAKVLLRQIIDFNLQGRELQSRKFYHNLFNKQIR